MKKNASINSGRHPYLRVEKWDSLVFWKRDLYSQETQDRLDKWLNDWRNSTRKLPQEEVRTHL